MKKLELRQGLTSVLLAGIVLVTGSSLTGCKYEKTEYPNNNSTFVNKNKSDEKIENTSDKTIVFKPGEHIISKSIADKLTEKVKCKKTGSNKETGENEFLEFGTPIENKKTLIK